MFYPEDSLKKGGRFYLCWVADSWPVCFASITQRQLWSHDIRKICDDLLQVMNNESGRPANRFSLRLSSQLMRGLVRVYQKKVNMLLSELCMIGARVMKNSNKKFNIHETVDEMERQLLPLLELPAPVQEPVPEPEERVEEMIQQSGNVVTNIENITMKEAAIPEFQLPPNDGFGEENPNQALQLLQDRTLEEMLGAAGAGAGAGARDAAAAAGADLTAGPGSEAADRTREPERLPLDATMERISDHDITLFRKSTAQDLLPEEFEKEIPIPEILPPDLLAPTEKECRSPIQEPEVAAALPPQPLPPAAPAPQEPEIVTLETLEEGEPQPKRRRKNKLIIDKTHQLTKKFLRARIENIHVDLRCEEFSDDIADLRVPAEQLLARPARSARAARALLRLFSRNLGLVASAPQAQREMEFALGSRARRTTPQVLEVIPEEPRSEPIPEPTVALLPEQPVPAPAALDRSAAAPDLRALDVEKDIADLLTQKLETAPQKRTSQEDLNTSQPKRQRCGYITFRKTQFQNVEPPQEPEIAEKENIPDNWQTMPPRHTDGQPSIPEIEIQRPSDPERILSMLQEAGLADLPEPQPAAAAATVQTRRSRRSGSGSGSSETMLGSLDRTKVSLGDSDHTTDSKRFIRDQWGTEGTMVKILKMVKAEIRPLNMNSLMAVGPVVPGYSCIIAARCFTSILKLKQHGFIKVHKDPTTLEILDIVLGPKFN